MERDYAPRHWVAANRRAGPLITLAGAASFWRADSEPPNYKAAQMKRDGAKLGTPERESANREHEAALVAFRALAEKIRPRSSA